MEDTLNQATENQPCVDEITERENLIRAGKDCAARFLEMKGYEIIARDYACEAGEIDIIARGENCIVFVEVKTRHAVAGKDFPEERLSTAERARWERVAVNFLMGSEACEITLRFDVIGIIVLGSERAIIRHHVNAGGLA